ncbi:TPA: hypothetical protein ACGO92_001732 [Streptococcus suis]|nr:hypothetical protein [Streptococcus suis]
MNQKQKDYDKNVSAFAEKFIRIKIPDDKIRKITSLVNKIIERKKHEKHHQKDPYKEKQRFTTGFLGEAALEILLGINIIDDTIGHSSDYHRPDIPGYKVGIKSVEFGNYPIIFKNNWYPQIICIVYKNYVYVCGLATSQILNTYQSEEYIKSPYLRQRKTKTGFYGFEHLIPIQSLADLDIYKT